MDWDKIIQYESELYKKFSNYTNEQIHKELLNTNTPYPDTHKRVVKQFCDLKNVTDMRYQREPFMHNNEYRVKIVEKLRNEIKDYSIDELYDRLVEIYNKGYSKNIAIDVFEEYADLVHQFWKKQDVTKRNELILSRGHYNP
jgi:hypothetical protein